MLAWALRDSHNAWQSYSRVSYGKCTWLHCSRQLFLGNMSSPCSWQQTNSFATKLSCSFVCQWATYPESHLRPLDLQWFFCSHGASHFQGFGNKERGGKSAKFSISMVFQTTFTDACIFSQKVVVVPLLTACLSNHLCVQPSVLENSALITYYLIFHANAEKRDSEIYKVSIFPPRQ